MAIANFTTGEILDQARLNELITEINTLDIEMEKAKRGPRQVIQNHVKTAHAYSAGSEIGVLTTSITLEEDNSKVLYNLNISHEIHWDIVFVLQRRINSGGWTEIGSGNANSSNYTGFLNPVYDQNNDSTPQSQSKSYLDSPNASAGDTITYRIFTRGGNYTLYLNRAQSGSSAGNYERASSSVILTEVVQ